MISITVNFIPITMLSSITIDMQTCIVSQRDFQGLEMSVIHIYSFGAYFGNADHPMSNYYWDT